MIKQFYTEAITPDNKTRREYMTEVAENTIQTETVETPATAPAPEKKRVSIRTNTLAVGTTYDFEIYNNGQKEPVLRAPATVISIPFTPLIVKDMSEDDQIMLQVEGEDEPRALVRNGGHPFYLITRVDGKRNSRVRFHSVISEPEDQDEEVSE